MKNTDSSNQIMNADVQDLGSELILMLIGKDAKAQESFRRQVLKMARSIRNNKVRNVSFSRSELIA